MPKRWTFELDDREHTLLCEVLDVYLAADSPAVDITTTQTEEECGWKGAPYTADEFTALRERMKAARTDAESG